VPGAKKDVPPAKHNGNEKSVLRRNTGMECTCVLHLDKHCKVLKKTEKEKLERQFSSLRRGIILTRHDLNFNLDN